METPLELYPFTLAMILGALDHRSHVEIDDERLPASTVYRTPADVALKIKPLLMFSRVIEYRACVNPDDGAPYAYIKIAM